MRAIVLIFIFGFQFSLNAKDKFGVELDNQTIQDGESVHIVYPKPKPSGGLILPQADSGRASYFSLFYTWDEKPDPSLDVMRIQNSDSDILYIDRNNDENLTNDGSPILFNHSDDYIEFDITSSRDSLQKTRLFLSRKPIVADSMLGFYLDDEGNMIEQYAKVCGVMKGDFDFKGEKGSFYFDGRVSVKRGVFSTNGQEIEIGLFDENNNGLFSDSDDLILLDLDGNGKLYQYENEYEVFKLSDVFSIFNQNYKVNKIDKYGNWIELEKTNDKETFYYFQEALQEIQKTGQTWSVTAKLHPSFWDLILTDIDGETIVMSEKKNKYILLNFWGEWCGPCIHEIPELVKANNTISSENLEIISFVNTSRIDLVRKITVEKKMSWTQILLSKELQEQFRIVGYPTNILILKNGETYLQAGTVSYEFIARNIK